MNNVMDVLAHVIKLFIIFCSLFEKRWFTSAQLENKFVDINGGATFSTITKFPNKWWFQQLQSQSLEDICKNRTALVDCPYNSSISFLDIPITSSSFAGIIKYEYTLSSYYGASLIVLGGFGMTEVPQCLEANEVYQFSAGVTYYKTPGHGNSPVINFTFNNDELPPTCSFGYSGITHTTTCTATTNNITKMDNKLICTVYFNKSSWNIATQPGVSYASNTPGFQKIYQQSFTLCGREGKPPPGTSSGIAVYIVVIITVVIVSTGLVIALAYYYAIHRPSRNKKKYSENSYNYPSAPGYKTHQITPSTQEIYDRAITRYPMNNINCNSNYTNVTMSIQGEGSGVHNKSSAPNYVKHAAANTNGLPEWNSSTRYFIHS